MNPYLYQEQARNLLEETEENLLVIAPTGMGKTEVGLMALEQYGCGVYVAPTRALCYEKAAELRKRFPGKRVVIGNKDHSLDVAGFRAAPFRVVTPWKLGVILQNNPRFLADCPVVVVDEIHTLAPEMELLLTQVMQTHPGVRFVALSATIHQDDEGKLATWLSNAVVVKEKDRLVPLITRLVHFDADISDGGDEITRVLVIEGRSVKSAEIIADSIDALGRVKETVRLIRASGDNSPILIYTPYRERARQLAELLSGEADRSDESLVKAAASLAAEAGDFTDTLKACLPKGIGVHHGGCTAQEREMVYELAVAGKLKIIVTCQTLAQGINMPARHVVVESVYDNPRGGGDRRLMDVSLFWQVAGRAGRPQYDSIGYLWVPVASELERVEVEEVLFKNRASKIISRVYDEYFLASQIAGLIRLGYTTSNKLAAFMRATFFGTVLQDVGPLIEQFERLIVDLVRRGFAMAFGQRLILTDRGLRLARLGFHPSEYEAVESLIERRSLDYEEWVRALLETSGEQAIGQAPSEEEIVDVVTFGMTAHTVRTSHHVRELVDYLSRLLELTGSLLRFNNVDDVYQAKFREEVADRFQFGELELARKLAGVVGRVAVRRILRNFGKLERMETDGDGTECRVPMVLDDSQLRAMAKALWRQTGLPPNGKIGKVAGVLGVTEARFRRLTEEAVEAEAAKEAA
jgi:helicase